MVDRNNVECFITTKIEHLNSGAFYYITSSTLLLESIQTVPFIVVSPTVSVATTVYSYYPYQYISSCNKLAILLGLTAFIFLLVGTLIVCPVK